MLDIVRERAIKPFSVEMLNRALVEYLQNNPTATSENLNAFRKKATASFEQDSKYINEMVDTLKKRLS